MINYNIEWLFDEVYKLNSLSTDKLNFISDWDVHGVESYAISKLLEKAYGNAANNSREYRYAYEQFGLKKQIIEFAKSKSLQIEESEITITPSATISLYLAIQSLQSMNIKRLLVITPAYFSLHETLAKTDCSVFYYHLRDDDGFSINMLDIERLITEQFIQGVIITDPIYSAGVELSINDYSKISTICNNNNAYLVVDYSLGGLIWSDQENFLLNEKKLTILRTCRQHLFIDNPTKRLLLNGIKFSTVIGDQRIIDKFDLLAESVFGGLSSAQCYFISELYKQENKYLIDKYCAANITILKENYNLIKSTLIGTDFWIQNTNSGYFSIVNHQNLRISSIDTKKFSLSLVKDFKILCITKDRFSYYPTNNFGFRVNLNKKREELIPALRQCIGIDYRRFNKGH